MRNTGSFSVIKLFDKINVNIIKGNEYKVEVTAGRHIIKNVSTRVIDNVLRIDNNNKCNFVRGYKRQVTVNITVPYIKKVESWGVGNVVFDNDFSQDTLFVVSEDSGDIHINGIYNEVTANSHGNGDIYLDGTCNSLILYSNGINFLKGDNMLVNDYIFVETLSIGDCHVNASHANKLDCYIRNTGNIYYKGNPPVINNMYTETGKGKLLQE